MEKSTNPTFTTSCSQPTDKPSQVGAQMHTVMRSAASLERKIKRHREELHVLAGELCAVSAELKQFEEEVAECARLVEAAEAGLERRDAADKIRSSVGELKKSQDVMEAAARLVGQALAKIENRRGAEPEE